MTKNKVIRAFYYLLKRLAKAFVAFFIELTQETAALKGEDFERCLRRRVFKKDEYDLVMKTHDFYENKKDYVESSLYPDYLFRERDTKREFFVEAKYRGKSYHGKIEWCHQYQFKRYKRLSTKVQVIIAIGFEGRPDNPKHIFLVPLDHIEFSALYVNFLEKYEFKGDRKNLISIIADRLYDYN